jgi:hypothetical protein
MNDSVGEMNDSVDEMNVSVDEMNVSVDEMNVSVDESTLWLLVVVVAGVVLAYDTWNSYHPVLYSTIHS